MSLEIRFFTYMFYTTDTITLQACKSLKDTCVSILEIHKNLMLLLPSTCLYNYAQEVCHTYFIPNLRCFSIMFNIVNFILCALGRDLLKSFKLLSRLCVIIIKQYIPQHNFPSVYTISSQT